MNDFRRLQVQTVMILISLSQLVLLPLMLHRRNVDARAVSILGLSLMASTCIGCSYATVYWSRDQFNLWQSLQSTGHAMVVMPLLMMATNTVKSEEPPFASALINFPA